MIRGRVNPLFKTPRVVIAPNFTSIRLGLLVSGGCTRVIGSYDESTGEYQVIVDWQENHTVFAYEPISDQEQEVQEFIEKLISIYGIVSVERVANDEALTVEGYTLSAADAYELDDSASNFEYLGLCEGLTEINNEEGDTILGVAIWHNGALYVPVKEPYSNTSYLLTDIQLSEAGLEQPLSVILANPSYISGGQTSYYQYSDLIDVLSESGLTIRKVVVPLDNDFDNELPAIQLACDTTDLWLNG